MKCPVCPHELKEVSAGEVLVDICDGGCGGIWFDNRELQRMDDADEPLGATLLRIAVDMSVSVDHSARRNCPRCKTVVMMRHFYSDKHQVEVDSCAGCGGYWLDAGELDAIRAQYGTESDREDAADQDFSAVWKSAVAADRAEFEKETGAIKKVGDALKWIRASYYLRGK